MSQAQDAAYQPRLATIEHPQRVGTGFDLRTHIQDARTGELIRKQPYRCFCEGRSKYYERPKFSGNLWYESGIEAGRRVQDAQGNWIIDTKLKHVAFTEATTGYTKPEMIAAENEQLRAELAALKAESEAKIKVSQPQGSAKTAAAPTKG